MTGSTGSFAVGAHWIKAALQVNPFGYVGKSSPSKSFADDTAYNTAILDRCVAEGIDLIAVTDHWCIDSAKWHSIVQGAMDHYSCAGLIKASRPPPSFVMRSRYSCTFSFTPCLPLNLLTKVSTT